MSPLLTLTLPPAPCCVSTPSVLPAQLAEPGPLQEPGRAAQPLFPSSLSWCGQGRAQRESGRGGTWDLREEPRAPPSLPLHCMLGPSLPGLCSQPSCQPEDRHWWGLFETPGPPWALPRDTCCHVLDAEWVGSGVATHLPGHLGFWPPSWGRPVVPCVSLCRPLSLPRCSTLTCPKADPARVRGHPFHEALPPCQH